MGEAGGLPDASGERASTPARDGDPRLAPRHRSPEGAETSGAALQQSLSSPVPPGPPAPAAKDPASHPHGIPGEQPSPSPLRHGFSSRRRIPTAVGIAAECRRLGIPADGSGRAAISSPFPPAALIFPSVTSSPHLDQTISAPPVPQGKRGIPCAVSLVPSSPSLWLLLSSSLLFPPRFKLSQQLRKPPGCCFHLQLHLAEVFLGRREEQAVLL